MVLDKRKPPNDLLLCAHGKLSSRKALPVIFLLYSQLPYLAQETCFQRAGFFALEGTSQAVLGSSDQLKVPASLSLFLKSEKIPTTSSATLVNWTVLQTLKLPPKCISHPPVHLVTIWSLNKNSSCSRCSWP